MVSTPKNAAYPDVGILIAMCTHMADTLTEAQAGLEKYKSQADATVLLASLDSLHGSMNILNLCVAQRFVGDVKLVVQEAQSLDPGSIRTVHSSVQAALENLSQYVHAGAIGSVPGGAVFLESWESLEAVSSSVRAPRVEEIFLPVVAVREQVAEGFDGEAFLKGINPYVGELSQAIEVYDRDRSSQNIVQVRTSLLTMEAKKPPAGLRLLLSLAISMCDSIMRTNAHDNGNEPVLLKRANDILSAVDLQSMEVPQELLSSMTYHVAARQVQSARTRMLDQQFDISRLWRQLDQRFNMQSASKVLEICHALTKAWDHCNLESLPVTSLGKDVDLLSEHLAQSGSGALSQLGAHLKELLSISADKTQAQDEQKIRVAGASVLMAIQHVANALIAGSMNESAAVDIAAEHESRMAQIFTGHSDTLLRNARDSDDLKHASPLLDEAHNNIAACEQIVDQCLRDGAKEPKISEAMKLFSMASAALLILGMDDASELAEHIQNDLGAVLQKSSSGEAVSSDESQRLAQAFLQISRYIRIVAVDASQAKIIITQAMSLYETNEDAAEVQDVDSVFDECLDDELGPIFFEEVGHIVEQVVLPGIRSLRSNPSDEKALLEVRRGFHTLKGSARMVNLVNLGMVGQYAEYALNHCRDNRQVLVTADLLDWLEDVASLFTRCIGELSQGKRAILQPQPHERAYKSFVDQGVVEGWTRQVAGNGVVVDSDLDVGLVRDGEPVTLSAQTIDSGVDLASTECTEDALVQVDSSASIDTLLDSAQDGSDSMDIDALSDGGAQEILPSTVANIIETSPDVQVGDIKIAHHLYPIFNEESRRFYNELEARVSDLIAGRRSCVDFEMERLAHSLAGMGRTTGLTAITELCADFESWAAIMKDSRHEISDDHKSVLRDFLEALESMIIGVSEKIEPVSDTSLTQRIKKMVGEIEHVAAHGIEEKELSESFFRQLESGQAINDTTTATQDVPTLGAGAADTQSLKLEPLEPLEHVNPSQDPSTDQAKADAVTETLSLIAQDDSLGQDAVVWLAAIKDKDDDLDEEMLSIFIEEADIAFEEIDASLAAMDFDLGDKKSFLNLRRSMHTLKGSSNTAGARKVGILFHHLEDMLSNVTLMSKELVEKLQTGIDAAFAGIQAMKSGRSVESAVRKSILTQVTRRRQGGEVVAAQMSEDIDISSTNELVTVTATTVTTPSPAAKTGARNDEDDSDLHLKVTAKALDRMVKNAGEIGIAKSRIQLSLEQSRHAMTGLTDSLNRMNGYLKAIELEAEKQMFAGSKDAGADTAFDALQMDRFTKLQELTRRVSEAQNDVMLQRSLSLSAIKEIDEAISTQNVLIADLSTDLDQIRRVRVSSIVPSLRRTVRSACREADKEGNVYFDADVEVDRGILDKVMVPVGHILRNAIAHGIEKPQDRKRLGKPRAGSIEFKAYQDGSEVVIQISDDGAGISAQKVLAKAVDKGLVKHGVKMADEKVYELLFEPGFSTAESVTELAGRGVGLDIVRSQISAMGGRIDVRSNPGSGTTFSLRIPATLTVMSGLCVSADEHMYVIPVAFVERLVRIDSAQVERAYTSRKLSVVAEDGEMIEYDFAGLWQIVGSKRTDSISQDRSSVLLMRSSKTAIHVEDIKTATEYVFRPMGPQLVVSSGLIGSTIMPNGLPALVLDPGRVMRSSFGLRSNDEQHPDGQIPSVEPTRKSPLVMVVDDSLTVRKVTARLLKKEGYRCVEAENGMQALEKLQLERPAVVLMDIEMPVMNGFEAVQTMKATQHIKDIPVIMITSRVGESHKQKAMELGVNEYLGKPYNDVELLSLIQKYSEVATA